MSGTRAAVLLRALALLAASIDVASPVAGETPVEAPPPAPFVHAGEGAFTALFPEAPRYEERSEPTLLGALHTRSWEVERGGLRLRVERHDVPVLASFVLGPDALLARAARGLLADLAAKYAQEEPAALRGYPGRHLRYEPGDRPGETEDAWLYLLGRRLYVIFARGVDPEAQGTAARFAASVELLEE